MTWRYESRRDDVLKNAYEFLHNPEGTASVRGWWCKHWGFEYTRKDLIVRFNASQFGVPDKPYIDPVLGFKLDPCLGPLCYVSFDKKELNLLLAEKDYLLVVVDIKCALKSQWQFFTVAPPPVEQVAFRNKELERFGDYALPRSTS